MERYYIFKMLKTIVDSWRVLQLKNSFKRRARLHMRDTLSAKPQLAKPLFALRNLRLYKAFETFKLGIQEIKRFREIENYSSFAFYIKNLRNGFDGFRLNTIQAQ